MRAWPAQPRMAANGESIYQVLERELILGHLKPRERLLEAELCRRLGISRTLLREVFRRLEGAGLVTLQPNRGVVVRDFSLQEVEDVYYLRTALERAAIPLIVERVRPADIRALRELQREFERACRAADMGGMILSNLAFHRRLSQISGNPFLYKSLEISHLQTQQIRYVAWLDAARVQKSIREHRRILAALARRSTAAYEQALVTHLAGGKGDYQRIYPVGGDGERAQSNHGVRTARRRAARREEETHA